MLFPHPNWLNGFSPSEARATRRTRHKTKARAALIRHRAAQEQQVWATKAVFTGKAAQVQLAGKDRRTKA